jgi:thiol-disulfide isomerase/thioredoxin
MSIKSLAAVAALLGTTAMCAAQGQETTLKIGDKAPPIDIAHWLKGDTIEGFENDKVYVVEFWATWCGPCISSMPHLSEMQEKYSDYGVTFISVSDEPLQTVYEFMFKTNKQDGKINNDRMQYTVATDPDESVKKDYFLAAGRRGIPCAFIVGKKGEVEWIGHPMQMDDPLESVVHDTWEREAFATKFEQGDQANRKSERIMRAMREAYEAGKWDDVIAQMDQLIALGDQYSSYKIQRFLVLAKELDDADAAFAYAREIAFDHWDDPMILNQLAWFTVDEEGIPDRDLKFAMKAAKRACELTEESDAAILDTVARVYYDMGNLEEAIAWQKKAVANLSGTPLDEDVKKTLEKYESEKKK